MAMALPEFRFYNFSQSIIYYPATIQVQHKAIGTVLKDGKWLLIASFVVTYLILVQALRFRRLNKINKTYAAYLDDPHSLDYKTAHKIMRNVMLYEGPFMYLLGTQMGILKSYTAQTGTKTLAATGQLTRPSAVGRRSEDTMTMLMEYIVGSVDSERGLKSMSKTNWLHRRYGNLIRSPELMHVMSMFVLEPMRWFDMYEWRPMTRLEKVAIYVYWKELAARLGIKDVPHTLDEFQQWQKDYLAANMYPCPSNNACAEGTLGIIELQVPQCLKSFVRNAVLSVLEEDVRVGMGLETPPVWISRTVHAVFKIRQFIIRHFYLPRFSEVDVMPKIDEEGRMHRTFWAFEPWYVHASRWESIKSWFFNGGNVVPGKEWKSAGSFLEDMGPARFEGLAQRDVLKEMEKMREYADGGGGAGAGCPFKFNG